MLKQRSGAITNRLSVENKCVSSSTGRFTFISADGIARSGNFTFIANIAFFSMANPWFTTTAPGSHFNTFSQQTRSISNKNYAFRIFTQQFYQTEARTVVRKADHDIKIIVLVTDEAGKPLPGADCGVVETGNTKMSGADGVATITTKSTDTLTLRCSLTGYRPQEKIIDMADDAATLQTSIILKPLVQQ